MFFGFFKKIAEKFRVVFAEQKFQRPNESIGGPKLMDCAALWVIVPKTERSCRWPRRVVLLLGLCSNSSFFICSRWDLKFSYSIGETNSLLLRLICLKILAQLCHERCGRDACARVFAEILLVLEDSSKHARCRVRKIGSFAFSSNLKQHLDGDLRMRLFSSSFT